MPPDLGPAAGAFLVALQPSWQQIVIDEGFSCLHLPASHLLAALSAAVTAGQHQQQQPGDKASSLLPGPGLSCAVDLQLVAVTVEGHPLVQQHGCVGAVQQLSNVMEGAAVLQAQPDCSGYR